MLKKIISPILYAFSSILALFALIYFFIFLDNYFPFIFPGSAGMISDSLLVLLIGISIFWLMNIFMAKIENLKNPKIIDHFRQSGIYYALFVFASYNLVIQIFEYIKNTVYLDKITAVIFVFSALAIITNAAYLFLVYRKSKKIQ